MKFNSMSICFICRMAQNMVPVFLKKEITWKTISICNKPLIQNSNYPLNLYFPSSTKYMYGCTVRMLINLQKRFDITYSFIFGRFSTSNLFTNRIRNETIPRSWYARPRKTDFWQNSHIRTYSTLSPPYNLARKFSI